MLLLTLLIVFWPSVSRNAAPEKKAARPQEVSLEEFEKLKARYESLRTTLAAAGGHGASPSLLTAMDALSRESGIAKGQLVSMTPTTPPREGKDLPLEYVEVRLERMTLMQLHDYLTKVETSAQKRIFTDRIQIKKRTDKPQLLDVVVRAYSLASARGG